MAKKKPRLTEKQLEQVIETRVRVENTMKMGKTFRNFLPVVDETLFKLPALKPITDSEPIKNMMVGTFFEMALELLSGQKINVENISFETDEEAPETTEPKQVE